MLVLLAPRRTRAALTHRLLRDVDGLLYAEIAERRRADDLGERGDVLSMLLQARREDGRPMEARVRARDKHLAMELLESKSSVPSPPETWGLEPLVSTRRGGFGMGLFYARQVLEAHEGEVTATFDPEAKQLTTRLSLPIVGS